MTKIAAQNGQLNNNGAVKRLPQPEMLRCLAMLMVVILHFLGKGNLLGDLSGSLTVTQTVAWLLEAIAICAVNLYMLLSGYFLSTSHFKLSRLLGLLIQVWTYSVGVGALGIALGFVPASEVDTYFLLRLIFPISQGHYWFLTAYVYLYLLLPLITAAVKNLNKKAFQTVLALLFITFCVIKSVMPFRFDMDQFGYDCLWYLCVFLAAAYYRRFGIPFLEKRSRGVLLYVVSVLLIFAGTMALHTIYMRTGRLELLLTVCYDYNHILTLIAALGLFGAFMANRDNRAGDGILSKAALWAGPYTLGVYLLHENLSVRYWWQPLLGAAGVQTVAQLLLGTVLAAIEVFIVGIFVEALRSKVMQGIHAGLLHISIYRKIYEKIKAVDGFFE